MHEGEGVHRDQRGQLPDGAITSAEHWLLLREMRNEFSHDYPDDPAIQSAILNKAYNLASDLLGVLDRVEIFAADFL